MFNPFIDVRLLDQRSISLEVYLSVLTHPSSNNHLFRMSHSSTPNGCYYCRQVRAPCRHPLNRPTPRTWPPPQYMPVRSLPEFPRSDPDNESERQTTDIQSSRPTRGPSLPNINRLQPTLERSYGFIFEHDDDNTMPPRRSRPQVRPQVEARPEGVQNATLSVAVNDYEFPLTRGNHVAGIGALSSFPRATSRLSGVSIQRELPFIADTQE